jgi:hypothetical protein
LGAAVLAAVSMLNLWSGFEGAYAARYVVDKSHPAASDSNIGSETSPWKTVQKAANTAVAGDTVAFKNGTYNERVTLQNSGTPDHPVTFMAFPGHSPVIDGTGLGGWWGVVSIYGKDWICLSGFEICNNNTGWGVLIQHDGSNDASQVRLIGLNVHHTAGEAVQIRGNAHDILVERCTVHDGLGPYSGVDVYSWSGGRPQHVTVTGCTAYHFNNGYPGAGIGSEMADDLTVTGNTVYGSKIGVDAGSGDRNLIDHNHVYDCETGIALSSNEDSEVRGNLVHDIIDEGFYNYYWSLNGEAHARNRWHDNMAFNIGWGFYESNVKGSSGSEGPTRGHKYYNNLFYNIRHGFIFKGTTDLQFCNNTVFMNSGSGAIQLTDGAVGAEIFDNIISVSGGAVPISIDGTSGEGAVIDYNCYQNRSGASGGPGAHSVAGDPLFVSVASSDFHLQAGSFCVNSGVDLSARFLLDLDSLPRPMGNGWDMGCYEFETPHVLLSAKVFLEGAFQSGRMRTDLQASASIPTTSPYGENARTVSQIPFGVVDWVLVQLRNTPGGPAVLSKSVFLRSDGRLAADDGQTSEIILDAPEGNYYLTIRQRNHLAVISAGLVHLTP